MLLPIHNCVHQEKVNFSAFCASLFALCVISGTQWRTDNKPVHSIIAVLKEDCTAKFPIKFHSNGKMNCNIVENCILLGNYTASSGNFLPTFWDKLSVPSSGVKNPKDLYHR